MNEWSATIQSLISFIKANKSQHVGPSRQTRTATVAWAGDRVEGATPTVQSPSRQQAQEQPWQASHTDEFDEASMALYGPRDRRDQRCVLEDRQKEDARITIERRREAHCQSDRRNGPSASDTMPSVGGYLPYEVGCPAFTRELRQVR